jgi:hypothetical protein
MMTTAYSVRLDEALSKRGYQIPADAVIDAIREANQTTTESLTASEHDFLLRASDLTEDDLLPEARATAQARLAQGRIDAENQVLQDSLTTGEVAKLLGRDPASIRRSKARGDLYGLDGAPGRASRFPTWQFTGAGGPLPGLRRIIAALPPFYGPLSVQRFMTTARDRLDGLSPVQWLTQGGSVGAVVDSADEQGYL